MGKGSFVYLCLFFSFVSRQLVKEEIKMTNKNMKRFSVSVLIREILIEMTKRYHFSLTILSKNKTNDICLGGRMGTNTFRWECKLSQSFWNSKW